MIYGCLPLIRSKPSAKPFPQRLCLVYGIIIIIILLKFTDMKIPAYDFWMSAFDQI